MNSATIMKTENLEQESAIRRGIHAVGIGKRGSKALTADLAQEILEQLKSETVPPAARGAFFAALVLKGVTAAERVLEQAFAPGTLDDQARLAQALAADVPGEIQTICARLLSGETLDQQTAKTLGHFLFSDHPGDGARGLAASALRVRYETPEEYAGLLSSMQETIQPGFCTTVPAGEPVVQLAEPFDGVSRSYLITPLLANFIQSRNYRVVALAGESSGPKFGNNLLDLARTLNQNPAQSNQDLAGPKPLYGWYFDQAALSPAVHRWVNIRRAIIKRPFPATLEKFLNPAQAHILVTSAFHPNYGEKMLTISEQAGFPAAIVLRNGREGTLAFSLNRSARLFCSVRQANGRYKREEIILSPQDLVKDVDPEERVADPDLAENARLVKEFQANGKTNSRLFDQRVTAVQQGYQTALNWIKENQ